MTIPGIGPIEPPRLAGARTTPALNGGKQKLGGISKMGERRSSNTTITDDITRV